MSAVPKLRFPEFEGKWEVFSIGDLGQVITGSTPSTKNNLFYGGDIPFFSPADIPETPSAISESEKTLTSLGFAKTRRVRKGATLFVCIGSTIGKLAFSKTEGATNQQINSVVPSDSHEDYFVFSALQRVRGRVRDLSATQAVPIINKSSFSSVTVFSPSLPEQQKIASFLSSVDKKIDLLRQKKDALELYKKGLMQKIFSQEIRFKQDYGSDFPDWEEVALGDVLSKFESGKSKSKNLDPNGEFIVIDMGGVDRQCKIVSGKRTKNNKDLLQFGQLVMPKDDIGGGNIIGKVVFVDENEKYVLGDHVYALTVDLAKADQKFLFYRVNSSQVNASLRKKANGTAQLGLGRDAVLKQEVMICCLAEQEKIASCFSAIDAKIQNISSQTDQMETFKKGLLQQMFV